jgi:hypothetical protein
MKDLVLISCEGLPDQGERILDLAEWLGVAARKVTIGQHPTKHQLAGQLAGGRNAVVVSADVLGLLRERLPAGALQELIQDQCAQLLVFSGDGSPQHGDLFRWITRDAIDGLVSAANAHVFRFPESGRPFSGPFAGQSFTAKRAATPCALAVSTPDTAGLHSILLANERPVFLRMKRGACELFLLLAEELPDVNERLDHGGGIEEHYDQLIPLLIFLRHSFGEACWRGVGGTARLIIDDPLLEPAYGYLTYAALRESMHSVGYAASIAFIPWNHWRTSKAKAAQALGQDRRLSVCVHGCDHSNREFDELDLGSLQWKADTALYRMERHGQRTGVPFDPVMVFPQGKYASPALAALRTSGYLAAVNTTCFPTNAGQDPLTVADLLCPAVTKFHGFPLFQRRYPQRLIDSAFDVFLGRPVLLVQHHDDFRDGYGRLEAFVEGLRKLEPDLTWAPLATQLMQSCMTRSAAESSREVRFFTGRFRFRNPASTPSNIVFSKKEPDPAAVSRVLVNGADVAFSFSNGSLIFEHRAEGGQVIDVVVRDRQRIPAPASRPHGVIHMTGVCTRRALSEFRDRALSKHPRLLAAATGIARRLKATGDSIR